MCLVELIFFNDTATTEIYTLSLHDALPIFDIEGSWSDYSVESPSLRYSASVASGSSVMPSSPSATTSSAWSSASRDRKSTRLNSSHANISYAVFCLKIQHFQDRINNRLTSA